MATNGLLETRISNGFNSLKQRLQHQLQKDISRLYSESLFTDVELHYQNVDIKSHRCILKARAPLFYSTFFEKSHTPHFITLTEVQNFVRDIYVGSEIRKKEKDLLEHSEGNKDLLYWDSDSHNLEKQKEEYNLVNNLSCLSGITSDLSDINCCKLNSLYYCLVQVDDIYFLSDSSDIFDQESLDDAHLLKKSLMADYEKDLNSTFNNPNNDCEKVISDTLESNDRSRTTIANQRDEIIGPFPQSSNNMTTIKEKSFGSCLEKLQKPDYHKSELDDTSRNDSGLEMKSLDNISELNKINVPLIESDLESTELMSAEESFYDYDTSSSVLSDSDKYVGLLFEQSISKHSEVLNQNLSCKIFEHKQEPNSSKSEWNSSENNKTILNDGKTNYFIDASSLLDDSETRETVMICNTSRLISGAQDDSSTSDNANICADQVDSVETPTQSKTQNCSTQLFVLDLNAGVNNKCHEDGHTPDSLRGNITEINSKYDSAEIFGKFQKRGEDCKQTNGNSIVKKGEIQRNKTYRKGDRLRANRGQTVVFKESSVPKCVTPDISEKKSGQCWMINLNENVEQSSYSNTNELQSKNGKPISTSKEKSNVGYFIDLNTAVNEGPLTYISNQDESGKCSINNEIESHSKPLFSMFIDLSSPTKCTPVDDFNDKTSIKIDDVKQENNILSSECIPASYVTSSSFNSHHIDLSSQQVIFPHNSSLEMHTDSKNGNETAKMDSCGTIISGVIQKRTLPVDATAFEDTKADIESMQSNNTSTNNFVDVEVINIPSKRVHANTNTELTNKTTDKEVSTSFISKNQNVCSDELSSVELDNLLVKHPCNIQSQQEEEQAQHSNANIKDQVHYSCNIEELLENDNLCIDDYSPTKLNNDELPVVMLDNNSDISHVNCNDEFIYSGNSGELVNIVYSSNSNSKKSGSLDVVLHRTDKLDVVTDIQNNSNSEPCLLNENKSVERNFFIDAASLIDENDVDQVSVSLPNRFCNKHLTCFKDDVDICKQTTKVDTDEYIEEVDVRKEITPGVEIDEETTNFDTYKETSQVNTCKETLEVDTNEISKRDMLNVDMKKENINANTYEKTQTINIHEDTFKVDTNEPPTVDTHKRRTKIDTHTETELDTDKETQKRDRIYEVVYLCDSKQKNENNDSCSEESSKKQKPNAGSNIEKRCNAFSTDTHSFKLMDIAEATFLDDQTPDSINNDGLCLDMLELHFTEFPVDYEKEAKSGNMEEGGLMKYYESEVENELSSSSSVTKSTPLTIVHQKSTCDSNTCDPLQIDNLFDISTDNMLTNLNSSGSVNHNNESSLISSVTHNNIDNIFVDMKNNNTYGISLPDDANEKKIEKNYSETFKDNNQNKACGFFIDLNDSAKQKTGNKESVSSKQLFSMFIDFNSTLQETGSSKKMIQNSTLLSKGKIDRRRKPQTPNEISAVCTSSNRFKENNRSVISLDNLHLENYDLCTSTPPPSRSFTITENSSTDLTCVGSGMNNLFTGEMPCSSDLGVVRCRQKKLPLGLQVSSQRNSWNADKIEDISETFKRPDSLFSDPYSLTELQRSNRNQSNKQNLCNLMRDIENKIQDNKSSEYCNVVESTRKIKICKSETSVLSVLQNDLNFSKIEKLSGKSELNESFVKLSDMDRQQFNVTSNEKHISITNTRMSRSIPEASWLENKLLSRSANSHSLSRIFPHLSTSIRSKASSDVDDTTASTVSSMHSSIDPSVYEESMEEMSDNYSSNTNTLGQDLLRMFLDEISPDVTVEVAGRRIKAHKCILSSRCQYFAAMLSGGWVESAGNVISLHGFSYSVVHFTLCHIYSGESIIPDSINIVELATLVDMLCLEGLKEVISYTLKAKYCHFFHKPCSSCIVGVLECLPLTAAYGLDELYQKCLIWITKHYVRLWPSKPFASLPREIVEKCYKQHIVHMTVDNVLETLMNCDKLLSTMPKARWVEPSSILTTRLRDYGIKFIAQHFTNFVRSESFNSIAVHRTWAINTVTEKISLVCEKMSMDQICNGYSTVHHLVKVAASPTTSNNPDYLDLLSKVKDKIEYCLIKQANYACRCSAWFELESELRHKIQTSAGLILLPNEASRRSMSAVRKCETSNVRSYSLASRVKTAVNKTLKMESTTSKKRPARGLDNAKTADELSVIVQNGYKSTISVKPTRKNEACSNRLQSLATRTSRASHKSVNTDQQNLRDRSALKQPVNNKQTVESPTSVQSTPKSKVPNKLSNVKPRYLEQKRVNSENRSPFKEIDKKPSTKGISCRLSQTYPIMKPAGKCASKVKTVPNSLYKEKESPSAVLHSTTISEINGKHNDSQGKTTSKTNIFNRLTNGNVSSSRKSSIRSNNEATSSNVSKDINSGSVKKSPVATKHVKTANNTQTHVKSSVKNTPVKNAVSEHIPKVTRVSTDQSNGHKNASILENGKIQISNKLPASVNVKQKSYKKEGPKLMAPLSRSGTFNKDEPTLLKKPSESTVAE